MLTTHRKLLDAVRDTRKTLYAVAAFYVVVGFIFALVSLNAGALLGTFLGFLIISGTLVAAAVLRTVLRTDAQVSALREMMHQAGQRLDRIETRLNDAQLASPAQQTHPSATHAETDENNPAAITAAALGRDVFPRLVTMLEKEQQTQRPAPSNSHLPVLSAPETREPIVYNSARRSEEPILVPVRGDADAPTETECEWRRAVQQGDLVSARCAFAAMLESVEPTRIDAMRAELIGLQRRTERSLRRAVSQCAAERDVDGLLDVIQEIRDQLPGHAMADEAARLEATLRERKTTAASPAPGDPLNLDEQVDHAIEPRRELCGTPSGP